jgi:excinuclease ABC subunit B
MPKSTDTTSAKPKAAKKSAATRTPNSKASKPELKPLDGYLADLLNPAINRGAGWRGRLQRHAAGRL